MRTDDAASGLVRILLAVALGALLAGGCAMVGPDYARPPVKLEQTWRETADQRVRTAEGNYKD